MLDVTYLRSFVDALREKDGFERIEPGLSNIEIGEIERRFDFTFPPDLRALLQFALPVGNAFPNWRDDSEEALRDRLNRPLNGIVFDVERNDFWLDSWGTKPSSEAARHAIVKNAIDKAPKLIPIFAHRFIPAEPNNAGNPVFSVHQTDIIYYGNDLADYFRREFRVPLPEWAARQPRSIRFWNDSLNWRD
jgi:hypothetical protein